MPVQKELAMMRQELLLMFFTIWQTDWQKMLCDLPNMPVARPLREKMSSWQESKDRYRKFIKLNGTNCSMTKIKISRVKKYIKNYMQEEYGSIGSENIFVGKFLSRNVQGKVLDFGCGPTLLYWTMFMQNLLMPLTSCQKT